jgi:hypothetical protein
VLVDESDDGQTNRGEVVLVGHDVSLDQEGELILAGCFSRAVVVFAPLKRHAVDVLEDADERLKLAVVIRVNDEDGTLGDGKLRVEAAVEEGRPHAQDGLVSEDLIITALEDYIRVLRVVVHGRIACRCQS